MSRSSAPWFRAAKNTWYICFNGKQRSLDVQGRNNRQAAIDAWHQLMAGGNTVKDDTDMFTGIDVSQIFAAYLADCKRRVTAKTLVGYRTHLDHFAEVYGVLHPNNITVAQAEIFANKPEWSNTYRNSFLTALVSAFKWAKLNRLIRRNPLDGISKPPKASRGAKCLIDAATHKKLVDAASEPFRSFLELLWYTGARPGEIAGLTVECINLGQGLAIVEQHKCARHGKQRVVYFCQEAVVILRELLKVTKSGLLFPRSNGEKMQPPHVQNRLLKVCRRAGVKVMVYGYRHQFATDMLSKGVADATVAALLGHSSTTMLHIHYNHLTENSRVLRDAVSIRSR